MSGRAFPRTEEIFGMNQNSLKTLGMNSGKRQTWTPSTFSIRDGICFRLLRQRLQQLLCVLFYRVLWISNKHVPRLRLSQAENEVQPVLHAFLFSHAEASNDEGASGLKSI